MFNQFNHPQQNFNTGGPSCCQTPFSEEIFCREETKAVSFPNHLFPPYRLTGQNSYPVLACCHFNHILPLCVCGAASCNISTNSTRLILNLLMLHTMLPTLSAMPKVLHRFYSLFQSIHYLRPLNGYSFKASTHN